MNDDEVTQRFAAADLGSALWTHEMHVRVAFLHLRRWPLKEAVDELRRGIKALNRANGVVDGPQSGYHETLTVAWTRLVRAAMTQDAELSDSMAFVAAHPELLSRKQLRQHYSRERLLGARARECFVEPDLSPLPD